MAVIVVYCGIVSLVGKAELLSDQPMFNAY